MNQLDDLVSAVKVVLVFFLGLILWYELYFVVGLDNINDLLHHLDGGSLEIWK